MSSKAKAKGGNAFSRALKRIGESSCVQAFSRLLKRIGESTCVQAFLRVIKRIWESKFIRVVRRVVKYTWGNYSIIVVCVLLFLIIGFIEPRFLRIDNLMHILRNSSFVGIIALGMTFVIITGGIDLSAGHVLAVSGSTLILVQNIEAFYPGVAVPLALAISLCILISVFIGMLNGVIITTFKLPPFIVTLAIGIIARAIAKFVLDGATVRGRFIEEMAMIGRGSIFGINYSVIVWLVMAVILGCVLKYTRFGTNIYAVGGNENAARYSGIAVNKTKIIAYTLTGLCIGIAALFDVSRMAAVNAATSGELYEFDAITAVVVGGTALAGGRGRILGTVFGAVMITAVVGNVMVMLGISSYLAGLIKGTIILVAVLLQRRDK